MTLIVIIISMSAFNERRMDVLLVFLSVLFVGRFDLIMKSAPFEKCTSAECQSFENLDWFNI